MSLPPSSSKLKFKPVLEDAFPANRETVASPTPGVILLSLVKPYVKTGEPPLPSTPEVPL